MHAFAVILAMMPSGALAEECVPWTEPADADVALPTGERYYVAIDCFLVLEGCSTSI